MQQETRRLGSIALAIVIACLLASSTAYALAGDYGAWTQAARVESIPGTSPAFNGASLDGCPFVSRDGKTFYMASNRHGRARGHRHLGVDAARASMTHGGRSTPRTVNSSAERLLSDDRPGRTPLLLHLEPLGGCGGDDIYTTRLRPDGWDTPSTSNLGC